MIIVANISEKQAKLEEEMERLRLEEMDEEEYDALSEQEKAAVDEKRLVIKKQRIKKLVIPQTHLWEAKYHVQCKFYLILHQRRIFTNMC